MSKNKKASARDRIAKAIDAALKPIDELLENLMPRPEPIRVPVHAKAPRDRRLPENR